MVARGWVGKGGDIGLRWENGQDRLRERELGEVEGRASDVGQKGTRESEVESWQKGTLRECYLRDGFVREDGGGGQEETWEKKAEAGRGGGSGRRGDGSRGGEEGLRRAS